MSRFVQIATFFALAAVSAAEGWSQASPVTLKRLIEALDSKLLEEKDIAEIVLEQGVSFRLTDEIERDLRRRRAGDLVILAVRNGYRPPMPEGPATVETACAALERGVPSADVRAHVEANGVTGPFGSTLGTRLKSCGASPELQRAMARRWIETNPLDGSLDQIEALLAAGVAEDAIAAKLGGAPLQFPADRETFQRLGAAGAGSTLLQAVATSYLEGLQQPLDLDALVVLQGAGIDPAILVQRIGELGTDFETNSDAAAQMQAAGLSAAISDAVLARRIRQAEEPLAIEGLQRGLQSGIDVPELIEAVRRRGVQFTLTADIGQALAAFPRELRKACLMQALEQQGYRGFVLPRAPTFNPTTVSGSIDLRLNIDHVEDVVVADDLLFVKNLRGGESTDDGSQVEQPLPVDLDPNTFAIELKDGRGEVAPYWTPERANGYILRTRVFDEKGGADRYHLRMTWRRGGANAGGERRDAPSLRKN